MLCHINQAVDYRWAKSGKRFLEWDIRWKVNTLLNDKISLASSEIQVIWNKYVAELMITRTLGIISKNNAVLNQ